MSRLIGEKAVLKAASNWAERTGKDSRIAMASAQEIMVRLRAKLPPTQYEEALRLLHLQYTRY